MAEDAIQLFATLSVNISILILYAKLVFSTGCLHALSLVILAGVSDSSAQCKSAEKHMLQHAPTLGAVQD